MYFPLRSYQPVHDTGSEEEEDDYEIKYQDNAIHCDDGPAVTGYKLKKWYRHGKLHNPNGPAIISKYNQEWYLDGLLHREDGPAMTLSYDWYNSHCSSNTTVYARHGKLHRTDGPALVVDNLLKVYAVDGVCTEYELDYYAYYLHITTSVKGPTGPPTGPGTGLGGIKGLPNNKMEAVFKRYGTCNDCYYGYDKDTINAEKYIKSLIKKSRRKKEGGNESSSDEPSSDGSETSSDGSETSSDEPSSGNRKKEIIKYINNEPIDRSFVSKVVSNHHSYLCSGSIIRRYAGELTYGGEDNSTEYHHGIKEKYNEIIFLDNLNESLSIDKIVQVLEIENFSRRRNSLWFNVYFPYSIYGESSVFTIKDGKEEHEDYIDMVLSRIR